MDFGFINPAASREIQTDKIKSGEMVAILLENVFEKQDSDIEKRETNKFISYLYLKKIDITIIIDI